MTFHATPHPSHRPTLAALAVAALLAACGGGAVDTPNGALDAAEREQAQTVTLPPLQLVPAGTSGNLVCRNQRAGAITVDNVEVPAGAACRLTGTVVRGSIQVAPGGIVIGSALQVSGDVQGDQARFVQVSGTTTRVAGNVELEGGGGAALSGIQVGGEVFVDSLLEPVTLRNLRVGGNLQFIANLGGAEISGNRITGNLQCSGNLPAPLASNNTAAAIEDQCLPGGGITPPPPPLSGNVTCIGLTIGAIRLDSVIVPAGASCTLLGTTLNGSVEVGTASRLIAENVNVTGGLTSDGAADLRIGGTSGFGGSLQVQRGAAATISGATVSGDLQIDAMAGPVLASSNRVTGNLQAMANRGGVTLNGNRMGGVMQCKDNLPAPTGSGNVATLKEDQCRGL